MAGASDEAPDEAGAASDEAGDAQESTEEPTGRGRLGGAPGPRHSEPPEDKTQTKASSTSSAIPVAHDETLSSYSLDRASYSPGSSGVYNAVFSPTSGGSLNGLIDRQTTQIDFYIGQPSDASAIPREKASVNPAITSQTGTENLTITLTCGFCDRTPVEEESIKYSPATGQKSSDAIFHIVPDRRLTKDGRANLDFQVKNMGIVYDNILLEVVVGEGQPNATGGPAGPGAEPASEQGLIGAANVVSPPDARPADLTITCFEEGNRVAVTLDPGRNEQLIHIFGKRNMQDDGTHLRVFHTGITVAALSQIERDDYLQLLSLVDPSKDIMKALSGDPEASVASSDAKTLAASDEQDLLKMLYFQGQRLYGSLFINPPDPALQSLMRDFDGYSKAGAPVLIRIEEQSVNIPWQFLYPPVPKNQAKDPRGFWGFRYEIVVDPLEKAAGYYPNQPLQYGNGPLLLATYHAASSDPKNDRDVSSMGQDLAAFLGSTMGFKGITKVDSRKDFLNALQVQGSSIQVLVAFTHAEGDTALVRMENDEIVATAKPAGPELRFSSKEYVTLDTLDHLLYESPQEDENGVLLSNRPLVLLNGCETGGAALYEGFDRSFPVEFLQMGARGVIATEAPIWTSFGYDFGSALMANLKSGQTASLALLSARQAFLRDRNNPLGLLYSYYGGVKASISIP